MAAGSRAALQTLEGEVAALRRELETHRAAVSKARARREQAEAEARTAMARLQALDEEEESLRAKFLNDPFWDKPPPAPRQERPVVKLEK